MLEQAFDQCWESLHYIWRIRICDSWKIPTEDLLNSFSSFCSNGNISSVNRALDCKKKVMHVLPKYISIFKQTCTWIKIYIIFSAKLIRFKKYIWQLKNFWYVLNLKFFHIFFKTMIICSHWKGYNHDKLSKLILVLTFPTKQAT